MLIKFDLVIIQIANKLRDNIKSKFDFLKYKRYKVNILNIKNLDIINLPSLGISTLAFLTMYFISKYIISYLINLIANFYYFLI